MDLTLLIMAAGIGTRFGDGVKQLEPVDDRGHLIMDYSIYDAMAAGFNKVVFVIRKDILSEFDSAIGQRMKNKGIQVEYAFQELDDIPTEHKKYLAGRRKPWGTGQAILAARKLIHEPFVVINADDYYGKDGLKVIAEYLKHGGECCMVGFTLKNTLSDNGSVTRGICVEEKGWLKEIVETKSITKETNLDLESLVSMNMWGFRAEFMEVLDSGFVNFFESGAEGEFLIPIFIGKLLKKQVINVKVLRSRDTWYGMTYKEDVPDVRKNIEQLVQNGMYPENF